MKPLILLPVISMLLGVSDRLHAELQDQGLNSIMGIIDKAIAKIDQQTEQPDGDADQRATATTTVVNLSRTLGTLSYSRLQCGEAEVLAEFTLRVQKMPETSRDQMRDAFQEGFDKSKSDTPLLSQDECDRLTRSRQRLKPEDDSTEAAGLGESVPEVVESLPVDQDPMYRHMRIAELSGQLAYRRKFCNDENVFTRDYNEYLESIPETYREDVKSAYWRGYKHGKRLNKYLTREQC